MRGRVTPQIAVANAITTSPTLPYYNIKPWQNLWKAQETGPFCRGLFSEILAKDERILMRVMTYSNAQEWALILQ